MKSYADIQCIKTAHKNSQISNRFQSSPVPSDEMLLVHQRVAHKSKNLGCYMTVLRRHGSCLHHPQHRISGDRHLTHFWKRRLDILQHHDSNPSYLNCLQLNLLYSQTYLQSRMQVPRKILMLEAETTTETSRSTFSTLSSADSFLIENFSRCLMLSTFRMR